MRIIQTGTALGIIKIGFIVFSHFGKYSRRRESALKNKPKLNPNRAKNADSKLSERMIRI